jgi:hypothetical protein
MLGAPHSRARVPSCRYDVKALDDAAAEFRLVTANSPGHLLYLDHARRLAEDHDDLAFRTRSLGHPHRAAGPKQKASAEHWAEAIKRCPGQFAS